MAVFVGIITLAFGAAAFAMALRRRFAAALLPAYLFAMGIAWIVLANRTEGYRAYPADDQSVESRPQEEKFDGFVTSGTCRACHPSEHHSWHASYHRTMTQVASPSAVRASFDGRRLEYDGALFLLERRGEEFWVSYYRRGSAAENEEHLERRIVMTTGSHKYQTYWLDGPFTQAEAPDDRDIWNFPFVYSIEDENWIPTDAYFIGPPEDHAGAKQKALWNGACIKCHVTQGAPRRAKGEGATKSAVAEFGIACEACHGPGEAHVAANRDPLYRYKLHRPDGKSAIDPTIVNPARLDRYRSSQVCARCHSIQTKIAGFDPEFWDDQGYRYRPGDDLHQTILRTRYDDLKKPPLRSDDTESFLRNHFWSDGMIRVTGREYNALLETPCFQDGEMSCLSCHTLHKSEEDARSLEQWADDQLGDGMASNRACTQCHEAYRGEASLAAHTHHPAGSSGSLCYNCHMPYSSYGLQRAIRAHQINSPEVAANLETGRPNACNQCHLDKTLKWTAETMRDWYGKPVPSMSPDEEEIAASILWTLKGDAGQRALMAWTFGWEEAREAAGDDWMAPFLAHLLEDPYLAVRYVATKSLRKNAAFNQDEFPLSPETARRALDFREAVALKEGREARKDLLLGEGGKLDTKTVDRLLQLRDNRPIYISE